jgi:signal transduction histidine kinase
VEDNGAGISKENIKKLFSDFGKLNEHKHMNVKGTGLGLSICKKIIEQLGGSVTVISKLGVGSNFIIFLDLEAQENIETNFLQT